MTQRPEADNRIDARLAELRRQQRKAFATYLVANYLDADGTLAHMRILARNGVDVIEVGYPFSDPILDGAVDSGDEPESRVGRRKPGPDDRSLRGVSRRRRLDAADLDGLRQSDRDDGLRRVCATRGGGRRRRRHHRRHAAARGHVARQRAQRDRPALHSLGRADFAGAGIRLQRPGVGGFLYCIPVIGPTGGPSATERETREAVERCRAATSLPIVVGFGIKSPTAATAAARYGDGVAVASALLERLQADCQKQGVKRALEIQSSEVAAYRRALDGERTDATVPR